MQEKNTETKSVEFMCFAPGAKAVFLAGSFNGWSPTDEPMARNKHDEWRTTLALRPGRYEYNFVVDGRWVCDPNCREQPGHQCPVCVRDADGSMNRVMTVE